MGGAQSVKPIFCVGPWGPGLGGEESERVREDLGAGGLPDSPVVSTLPAGLAVNCCLFAPLKLGT